MTFHDLPSDWPTRTLDDTWLAADVVDLVVREADRRDDTVTLLLCDADGRMIQPVGVDGVPRSATPQERRSLFDAFLGHLGGTLGGIVVALGREQGRTPDDAEREWHESAITACEDEGVRLLGCYLATRDAVTLMPRWDERELAS